MQPMSAIDDVQGVPATMLITVSARALAGAERPDLAFRDPAAERLVATLGIDPRAYCTFPPALIATVYRSLVLDRVTRSFCDRHPRAVVFNLACGLATNVERLGLDAQVTWIDADLPEVIDLRRRFFAETPHRHAVEADLTDPSIFDRLFAMAEGRPTLVLMEGVLYYLEPDDVRSVFERLGSAHERSGASCEIAFDMASPTGVLLSNANNTDTQRSGSEMKWGASGFEQLTAWDPRLELLESSDHERFLPPDFASLFAAAKARDGIGPFTVVHLRRSLT
jgi:O-methyltransferase involved in polyketide biosynthesis